MVVATTGCDGEGSGSPGATRRLTAAERATARVDSVLGLEALMGSPSQAETLAAVTDLHRSLAELLVVDAGALRAAGHPAAIDPSCYTSSAGRITLAGCAHGSMAVEGTIVVIGDRLAMDVVFVEEAGDDKTIVTVHADLRIGAAAVTGEVAIYGHAESWAGIIGYQVTARYDIVRAGACATGGSLDVHTTAQRTGRLEQAEDRRVEASFGPSCGDVR